jgi:hypothetical protein
VLAKADNAGEVADQLQHDCCLPDTHVLSTVLRASIKVINKMYSIPCMPCQRAGSTAVLAVTDKFGTAMSLSPV